MKNTLVKLLVLTLIVTLGLANATVVFGAETPNIKVQYNGQGVIFTDAVPKIVDGRTMVPFRQILETMGAQVTYDQPSKTVTAKTQDLQFSFAIGSTDIHITKDGVTTVKKTDVAPFIEKGSNRTLVGARFVAEAMGNMVGWDPASKTAIIMDLQKLFADADKDFSIIGLMMSNNLDMAKAYETTGGFQGDITIQLPMASSSAISMGMSGEISGIQQQMDADLMINFAINMEDMMTQMKPEEKAQIVPLLEMYKNINMKIKMDGNSGDMFMNSPIFATMDPSFTQDTWLKMSMYDSNDMMGMDIRPLLDISQGQISMSELLPMLFMGMETWDVGTYQDIKIGYAFLKNLMGDDAFKSKTSGTITSHTLTINQTKLLAAMAKTALDSGIKSDSGDMMEMAEVLKDMSMVADITIIEKADVLYNYSMSASGGNDMMDIAFDISGDNYTSVVSMEMEQKGMMKIAMKGNSKMLVTSKTPNLTPPAGAKIVDYNQYMQQLMMPVQ